MEFFAFIVLDALIVVMVLLSGHVLSCALQPKYVVHDPKKSAGKDLIVLVTGTSSGIGRDAAIGLANAGYHVYATVRKEKDAEKLSEIVIKASDKPQGRITPVIMDVTDTKSIDRVFKTIKERLDDANENALFVGLVNNAGVSQSRLCEDTDFKEAKALFDVNYFGVVQVTKTFLPLLRESKGRIVNIGSLVGIIAQPMFSTYAASKYAVEGYTDSLRRELIDSGVSVSLLEPGLVSTAMTLPESIESDLAKIPGQFLNMESYRGMITALITRKQLVLQRTVLAKDTTTPAILHAMRSNHPKVRYAVSNMDPMFPMWVIKLMIALVPDRINDYISRHT